MPEVWFAPICAYCERSDTSFWSEPLNALSNAAFLLAALAGGSEARRSGDGPALALALLAGLVGIGSFLFHTFAVRWSLLADVIPIALFIHAYFFLALRRYLALGIGAAIAATLLFVIVNVGLEPILDAVTGRSLDSLTNGSIGYVPAILALIGIAGGLLWPREDCAPRCTRRRNGFALLRIAALFGVSLAARTLDARLCDIWPIGTHFVWHILNAGVLYGLVRLATRHRAAPAPSAAVFLHAP